MGAVVKNEIGIGDLYIKRGIRPKNEVNIVSCANTTMDTIGKSN